MRAGFLVVLIAGGALSGCASVSAKPHALALAEDLFGSCRYEEAQQTLDRFIATASPRDAALAKVYLADLSWRRGDLKQTETFFREALDAGRFDAEEALRAEESLGKLLLLQGRYSESLDALELAMQLHEQNRDAHIGTSDEAYSMLAADLAEMGEWDRATEVVDKGIRERGRSAVALSLRAALAERDPAPGRYRRVLFGDDLTVSPANIAVAPIIVRAVAPKYPFEAGIERVEGYAVVEFTVKADGEIVDPHVIESKPPKVFDGAAVAAIWQWKMKPATRECQPVEQKAVQRMDFRLGTHWSDEDAAALRSSKTVDLPRPSTLK
ncbi:MAG TPA: TonB family protein [Burkholderiales bacterium]|nr:TonB family protein [Burkholderiales bacterium]